MAQQLTSDQLNLIGEELLSIGDTIGNYRAENLDVLSNADRQRLTDGHEDLLGLADELMFTTAMANIDDAQTALGQIKEITDKINSSLTTLSKIQTVINITGAVVALATTIVTGGASAVAVAADIAAAAATVEALQN